jgi:hypothetical protein
VGLARAGPSGFQIGETKRFLDLSRAREDASTAERVRHPLKSLPRHEVRSAGVTSPGMLGFEKPAAQKAFNVG